MDLIRVLEVADGRGLWAWLSTRGLMTVWDLEAELAGGVGRHGTRRLRQLIDSTASGALSAAEDVLHDLLRTSGIGGWQANARVLVAGRVIAVVDILFGAERLVVEVDGYGSHSSRAAFQRDRTRQNALVAAGYTVLRFTWDDLTRRPQVVVAAIRAALTKLEVRSDPV